MLTIRNYQTSDFEIVRSWWEERGMKGFTQGFMPDSQWAFIAEWRGEPVASISIIKTAISEYAYLENLVASNLIDADLRHYAVQALVTKAEEKAKTWGYKKLLCLAPNEKLSKRYQEMGYTPSLSNVTVQVKEL